jgi:DNA polymerase-3 subunit gamma/tau
MVLVRIAHAADLPTPDEAIRQLRDDPAGSVPARPAASAEKAGARASAAAAPARAAQPALRAEPMPQAESRPAPRLETFEDLVTHAGAERELKLKVALERNVRLIRFEPGRIEMELTGDAPSGLAGDLGRKLQEWTGQRWVISIGSGKGGRTLDETRAENRARMVTDARSDPLVAEVLARFPGAEIVDVRVTGAEPPPFTPENFPDAPDDASPGDDE